MVSCSAGDDEINDCADSEFGVNCQDADYIQNSDSPYVLPWEIGKTFVMGQVNFQIIHITAHGVNLLMKYQCLLEQI